MTKDLDCIINNNDKYSEQNFHDFIIKKNGIVFVYSSHYFSLMSIVAHNLFKQYTISDVSIENISDKIFLDLIIKYSEKKCINLKQIKEILLDHNCLLNIAECREKEWDFLSYRKWIVLKK